MPKGLGMAIVSWSGPSYDHRENGPGGDRAVRGGVARLGPASGGNVEIAGVGFAATIRRVGGPLRP
jgi:hypothetical protein